MVKARKWILEKQFIGDPVLDNFRLVEEDLPELKDGEILIEALFLTVDPYMRVFPNKVGHPPVGEQVARVAESKHGDYPVGKLVLAMVGWRDKTVITPDAENPYNFPPFSPTKAIFDLPDLGNVSPSLFLGILGMPGMTAYFGFLKKCQPKQNDTVLVSAAAGAVGSAVGQIAKIKGCTVIGSASSQEKCDWLKKLGFDHVFNYKETSVEAALQQYAPEGVDCYFDNVGGEYLLTVLSVIRRYGRICACGQISGYNGTKTSDALKLNDFLGIIMLKELVVSGIMVYSFTDSFDQARKDMSQWIQEGKLQYEETIREDFLKMPDTFIEIFNGTAVGKLLVKV
uniref:15-oxoprostaglandin 13-reductase n=1 Tax=Arion vulgaris TaxID=1028688 RepID=A0A0B6YNJ5_9EUPU